MANTEFSLDRELNIENNVDAEGRKWEIKKKPHSAMYFAVAVNARSDLAVPEIIKGIWTKPDLLQSKIKMWVTKTWDKAAEADKKAEPKRERARQVAKQKSEEK